MVPPCPVFDLLVLAFRLAAAWWERDGEGEGRERGPVDELVVEGRAHNYHEDSVRRVRC